MTQKPGYDELEEKLRRLREDLREFEKAEENLRIQKAYLQGMLDCAPEAIVLADRNQRITRVNAEFTRL